VPFGADSAAAHEAAFQAAFNPETAAAAAAQLNLAMSFLTLTQQAMLGNQGLPPSFPLGPNFSQAASIFAATAQANAAMTASSAAGAANAHVYEDPSTMKFEKPTDSVPLGDLSNVLNGNGPRSSKENARWGPPLPLAKMAGLPAHEPAPGLGMPSSGLAAKSIW
jgi:hypothetical protein